MKKNTLLKISILMCLFLLATVVLGSCKAITTTEHTTSLTTETVSTTITTSIPMQTVETSISRDQALAIASQYFPASEILQANFNITLDIGLSSDDVWQVVIYILNVSHYYVTRDQLLNLGWANSELSNIDGAPGYDSISVNIDAETGVVLNKNAGGVYLGTPPPVTS